MSQPKETKTSQIKLNLSPQDHERWKKAAGRVPVNIFIREAVEAFIKSEELSALVNGGSRQISYPHLAQALDDVPSPPY